MKDDGTRPKCPGQDMRFWKPGDIFTVKCRSCGNEIEFWKDEPFLYCRKCGREHVFYNLIREGSSPESAASLSKSMLIDYAHGKTKFERNVLNNLFFFYSFARGQATNTLHAMMAAPGAISLQAHTIDAFQSALKDPNSPAPPDIDGAVQSLRSSETGGRFLGMSTKGLPIVLSDIGLPIQDLTRYVNPKLPTKMTWKSLAEAGDDSVRRSIQTTIGQVNPLLRAPMEMAFNKNLFFDRPLDDATLRKIPTWENAITQLAPFAYSAVPKEVFQQLDKDTKTVFGGRDNGDGTMTINPWAMAILSNFVPGAGRALSTVKNLANPNIPWEDRAQRLLGSGKVQEIDPQKSMLWDRKRQLDEYIQRHALPTSRRDLAKYLRYNPRDEEQ